MKTKLLVICTGNKDRSPTAKALCTPHSHLDVCSAGTSKYAKTPLTEELVRWADVLVVMEPGHVEHINENYSGAAEGKVLYCLDIPDEFQCMNPVLVRMLQERLKPIVEAYCSEAPLRGENGDSVKIPQ